jgi:hypothetical protein
MTLTSNPSNQLNLKPKQRFNLKPNRKLKLDPKLQPKVIRLRLAQHPVPQRLRRNRVSSQPPQMTLFFLQSPHPLPPTDLAALASIHAASVALVALPRTHDLLSTKQMAKHQFE